MNDDDSPEVDHGITRRALLAPVIEDFDRKARLSGVILSGLSAGPWAFAQGESRLPVSSSSAGPRAPLALFRQPQKGSAVRSVEDKLRETASLRDFGAIGDGVMRQVSDWLLPGLQGRYSSFADLQKDYPHVSAVTDSLDWAAVQAAFSSGAKKVIAGSGKYMIGPHRLNVPDWLHIEGEAYQPGIGGDGRAVELWFSLLEGPAISCGHGPVLRQLYIQNAGRGITFDEKAAKLVGTEAIGIELSENAIIEDCCFSLWKECIRTGPATFYLKTNRVHFTRSDYGYVAVGASPYNLDIFAPHSTLTSVFFAGRGDAYPRNIKVFGGSIEGFRSVAEHFLEISCFGTYFETIPECENAIGFNPAVNNSTISLFGCLVFMNNLRCFINVRGLTNCNIASVGNKLGGIGKAKGIYIALPQTGTVSANDNYGLEGAESPLYVDDIEAARKFNLAMPQLPPGHSQSVYSGARFAGPGGFVMSKLSKEPVNKVIGLLVLADGLEWDPLHRKTSRPYVVLWQGDRWG